MKKKDIPWALLSIRMVTFVPIILSTLNIIPLTILEQILATMVIIGSDIFDGKISRKYNNEKDKLRFRLSDTIVDKTGIFSCLLGLLLTSKITLTYFALILGYNIVLLTGGALNLVSSKNKDEKKVQGLFISRLFTALTGISIILLNNVTLSNVLANILTISMGTIGISSLFLQLKDKLDQKVEIKNNDDNVITKCRETRMLCNIYLSKKNVKSYKYEKAKEVTDTKEVATETLDYKYNRYAEDTSDPKKRILGRCRKE